MVPKFIRGGAATAALLTFALGAPRAAHAQVTPAQPQATPAQQQEQRGVIADSVAVVGNRRIAAAAVRSTAGIQRGSRVTGVQVQAAIRRLMARQT